MTVQHFVQTRFSVKATWGFDKFPREWLERRLRLWEAYCLPSIAGQTSSDFTWLLYCDESTAPDVLDHLRDHERRLARLRVLVTGAGGTPLSLTRSLVHSSTELLLTTRLDSDDALNVSYAETVQRYAEPFLRSRLETLLVNFPRGYKLQSPAGKVYESRIPYSPFHTLFERKAPAREWETVLMGNHSALHEQHPTHQDESIAGWLQLLHGGNVLNGLWGVDRETTSDVLDGSFVFAERACLPNHPPRSSASSSS